MYQFYKGTFHYVVRALSITSDDKYIVYNSFHTVRLWNFQEELASVSHSGWGNCENV